MDMCHGRPTGAIVDALNQNTIHFSRPPMGPGPSTGIPLSYGNMPVHTQVRRCSQLFVLKSCNDAEGHFHAAGPRLCFFLSSAPPFVTDVLNLSKCRSNVFYYLPLVCSSKYRVCSGNYGQHKFKYGSSASAKVLIYRMIIVCISTVRVIFQKVIY